MKILVDSCCDLSGELRARTQAAVAPLTITIDGEDFVDDDTLDEAAIKQVAAWTDIEKISVSDTHAVGLKKDGTLVFAGDNSHGQFNIT